MAGTSDLPRRRPTRSVGMVTVQIGLAVTTAILCHFASAQEGSNRASDNGGKEARKRPAASPKTLLDSLVNHNVPPVIPEGYTAVFRKDYDWTERDRVRKAIDRVAKRAEELWPALVEHLTDERYCITWGSEGDENLSVGDICRQIISDNLSEAYHRRLPEGSDEMIHRRLIAPDVACHGLKSLKKWCEERKGKKLFELQVESSEWAIREIRGLSRVSEKDRRQATDSIRKVVASLLRTRQAIAPASFSARIHELWYLPGPEPSEDVAEPDKRGSDPREPYPRGKGEGMW
jgi:hypothetical protein